MASAEVISLAGYVLASSYRVKVLSYLADIEGGTPTIIAHTIGIRTNHISKVLSELSRKKVIECINPMARKGRIYSITNLGIAVNRELATVDRGAKVNNIDFEV